MSNYLNELERNELRELGFSNASELIFHLKRSFVSFCNPLFEVDVYKMGHMEQMAPGVTEMTSYLIARSDKHYSKTVFFGLQHLLQTYLSRKLTSEMAEEFIKHRDSILGFKGGEESNRKVRALCALGYFPLKIRAVPEGTIMPVRNVLMTVSNTLPEFAWVVGFVESLVLKVWEGTTTASCSFAYRQTVNRFFEETVDEEFYFLKPFQVHDFGLRGCGSPEQAQLTGVAHLLSFEGSDTVPAHPYAIRMYGADPAKAFQVSVPASEHSVACSYDRENELAYFEQMLDLYPDSIVSIVADTFNIWRVCTEFLPKLKGKILARKHKVVIRPDSGDPMKIICGDIDAQMYTPEWWGVLALLEQVFGSSLNKKGYRILNPLIGVIYGDGMYLERYKNTLELMKQQLWAAQNLVIGVGGILRWHTRDTMGFALKAIHIVRNGVSIDIEKDPVTDVKKKSHKGNVALYCNNGAYETVDQCTPEMMENCVLETVFLDGKVKTTTLDEIKQRMKVS